MITNAPLSRPDAGGHAGSTQVRRGAAVAAFGMVLVVATAVTAAGSPESSSSVVHVEGTLSPLAEPGVYRATGGMVGTYRALTEKVTMSWDYPNGTIRVIEGTDMITGCVDRNRNGRCDRREPKGELRFDFKRLATFDAKTDAFLESNCTHPVTRADGAFAGGLFFMRDVATGHGDEVKSTYRGDITLRG